MYNELLRKVPLFVALPDNEIDLLVNSLREVEYPQGEVLFYEGDKAESFYILLEGEVDIIKAIGSSEERLLGTRKAGSFIGEMSLFSDDQKRTATVRANSPLRMLEMTRLEFDHLLHRVPDLAYEMVRVLSRRLRESENTTILDLREKNERLSQAYRELQEAQAQIIEKAILDRELAFANRVQQSILPASRPVLGGFEFGMLMTPSRLVGGDFFDFVPLADGKLGIAVADVTDKGVPAAIFMAVVRSLLRGEASRSLSPLKVLRNVNNLLLEMNTEGMFATLLYGVLHPESNEFHYVRAGHEHPLLVSTKGEIHIPKPQNGQPLGILPEPDLDEQSCYLEKGSLLLLFTDGVTEEKNSQGSLFGIQRLGEAVIEGRQQPAQAFCDHLFEVLDDFRGTQTQSDDITIVAIKAT
jgi:sigma-B regulation protein RsbU (phosphoserine phosphatase)